MVVICSPFVPYEIELGSLRSSAYSVFCAKAMRKCLLIFGDPTREKRQRALSRGEDYHKYQGHFESLRCFRECAEYKAVRMRKKIAKLIEQNPKGQLFRREAFQAER